MDFHGKVHKFGDHIDTDQIIPAPYLSITDARELAMHCLETADPDFVRKVRPGDIIVGGVNFGCGSSREHAVVAITGCNVTCIVAKSFARIFFRNSINLGLPLLECPEAVDATAEGEELEVELASGTIRNLSKGQTFTAKPYEPFMLEIIQSGGLIDYTKKRLAEQRAD